MMNIQRFLVASTILVCITANLHSQAPEAVVDTAPTTDPKKLFEPRQYVADNGDQLNYRLLKPADYTPDNYDPNQKYPLVVFLHGAGERGSDNTAQLMHGLAEFCRPERRQEFPCYVLAPQCPKDQKWVDLDWSQPQPDYPESISRPLELTLQVVEAMLDDAAIDKSRVLLTGLSMGGYGTWDALARRPELFAAGLPICGGGDTTQAAKFKHIPVWCFHGSDDEVVHPDRSREMVAALRAAGGEPRYTEYAGVKHDSWSQTFANAQTFQWLFTQKK